MRVSHGMSTLGPANVGDGEATESERQRFRWIRPIAIVGLAMVLVLQLVPYGWRHTNPPVVQDAPWPDAASAGVARSSCYSCHSNETDWPLYSYVAPMSWLVRHDVESGRDELNFSDWGRFAEDAEDAIEVVQAGEMPPDRYTRMDPDAKLTDEERTILIDDLTRMSADEEHGNDREDEDDDDDDN